MKKDVTQRAQNAHWNKSQVQLVHPVIVTVLTTVQYVLGGLGCSESQDLDGRQNDTMTRPETDRQRCLTF